MLTQHDIDNANFEDTYRRDPFHFVPLDQWDQVSIDMLVRDIMAAPLTDEDVLDAVDAGIAAGLDELEIVRGIRADDERRDRL